MNSIKITVHLIGILRGRGAMALYGHHYPPPVVVAVVAILY